MKMRTRLPRASTNASVVASSNTEEPVAECSRQPDAVISAQRYLHLLQQLESFDIENVFTGQLTADGRLSSDGPEVRHNLRYLSWLPAACFPESSRAAKPCVKVRAACQ